MKNILLFTVIFGASAVAYAQQTKLPAPFQTKSVRNYSKVIGWPKGKTPVAPKGFKVSLYANNLHNPRNIYVAPNGDVFTAQANTEMSGLKKIGAALIGATKSQNLDKSATIYYYFKIPMAMALQITNVFF